jgi:hypothetical protein
MSDSDLYITILNSAKNRLIQIWGPEVVLRCSCGDVPSHSMWGQQGSAKCPICKQVCQTILHEWGVIDGS